MRLLLFLFPLLLLGASTSVDKKINATQTSITKNNYRITKMNRSIDLLIKKINRHEDEIESFEKQQHTLEKKKSDLSEEISKREEKIKQLSQKKEGLLMQKEKTLHDMMSFVSTHYYHSETKNRNLNDLIQSEVLTILLNDSNKQIKKKTTYYLDLQTEVEEINHFIDQTKEKKNNLTKQILLLKSYKRKKEKEIADLQKSKRDYKESLDQTRKKQKSFQSLLVKLNLVRKEEIKRRKEEEARRKAEEKRKKEEAARLAASAKNKKITQTKIDKSRVKKHGSAYIKTKTRHYRGKKTISPLIGARLERKFGTYVDPIYHIKVYNDSVLLAPTRSTKVRSIFNGEVVYVNNDKKNKMIVLKHSGGMYSVYARLSSISPYIKKGYRVKKGDYIARIKDTLEFEITYKDIPINPFEVITLKGK